MSLSSVMIGGRLFEWGRRTYVMGIVNVTPDSFAGDGVGANTSAAVARAEQLVAEGADIIDIGGESTRPGAEPVELRVELARVVPVIERLAGRLSVPISVDTSKSEVAAAALLAGATMVNDVHGLRSGGGMAAVVAAHRAAVVVMANLRGVAYTDVIDALTAQLCRSLTLAAHAAIEPDRVIVDPGFGFGVTPQENLEMVRRLTELRRLGRPILLGPSRKSTIGAVLGGLPVEQRLEGTAATVALAIDRGVDIVRVHDVGPIVRVARMADAITRVTSTLGER